MSRCPFHGRGELQEIICILSRPFLSAASVSHCENHLTRAKCEQNQSPCNEQTFFVISLLQITSTDALIEYTMSFSNSLYSTLVWIKLFRAQWNLQSSSWLRGSHDSSRLCQVPQVFSFICHRLPIDFQRANLYGNSVTLSVTKRQMFPENCVTCFLYPVWRRSLYREGWLWIKSGLTCDR